MAQAQPRGLWELIESRGAATPDGVLLIDDRGRQMSFLEYRRAVERVAAGLAGVGVGEASNVSWLLPTWLEAVVLEGALSRLGAVQNPLIPGYRAREVGFIAAQTRAQLLVVPSQWRGFDYAGLAAEVASGADHLDVLVVDAGERALPEGDPGTLAPAAEPPGPSDAFPVRWLFYTSGTTADPKGARHTDATIWATVAGMCQMVEPGPGDRVSIVFPFAHIGGAVWLFTALSTASTLLLVESFAPVTTIPMLAANGVTLAGTGTPFNLAYLAAQRELASGQPGARLFPRVRLFMSGASPKPPRLHHDLSAELGGSLVSSYGLTESPILTASSGGDAEDKLANTEGRACPGVRIRVVNADGATVGPDEEGELRVHGPQLLRGYVDASLNGGAFDNDGFLRTGDLGRLDADGFLTITGRLKDVIIRKGENISAKEVEDLLYEHPKVADVAVIGLPDAVSGERACAVVALRPGAGTLGFVEMQEYLRWRGLRTVALPEQLEIADEVPRNTGGKIRKEVLKARYGSTGRGDADDGGSGGGGDGGGKPASSAS
jgi:acyl-CoA synthetase (AMP-forming)/AMP-acid ligase II